MVVGFFFFSLSFFISLFSFALDIFFYFFFIYFERLTKWTKPESSINKKQTKIEGNSTPTKIEADTHSLLVGYCCCWCYCGWCCSAYVYLVLSHTEFFSLPFLSFFLQHFINHFLFCFFFCTSYTFFFYSCAYVKHILGILFLYINFYTLFILNNSLSDEHFLNFISSLFNFIDVDSI